MNFQVKAGKNFKGEIAAATDLEQDERRKLPTHDGGHGSPEGGKSSEGKHLSNSNSNLNCNVRGTREPDNNIMSNLGTGIINEKEHAQAMLTGRLTVDEVANTDNMEGIKEGQGNSIDVVNTRESPRHQGDNLGICVPLSSSSGSRTRTAQLSGIGYSEEMAMIYNKGLDVEAEEVDIDRETII